MNFAEETLKEAHRHSSHNRDEIGRSERCGCFYCGRVFLTDEIRRWVGAKSDEALCPYCGIDAILAQSAGYPLTREFLEAMHHRWFSLPPVEQRKPMVTS